MLDGVWSGGGGGGGEEMDRGRGVGHTERASTGGVCTAPATVDRETRGL